MAVKKAKRKIPNNPPNPKAANPVAATPRPGAAPRRSLPLPAKSLEKAAKVFKNFSLSHFPKGATPANYVPPGQAKVPAAVHAVQKKSVATQLTAAAAAPAPQATPGLSIAVTDLNTQPFYDTATNTVDLQKLLVFLKQNVRGTDFFSAGNPTLNRVVQDTTLRTQVKNFIKAVKPGGV